MTIVRVSRPATGPRVHVLGLRLHHGMTGALLVAAGARLRHWTICAAGLAAMAHDWHDAPWIADR